jgi:hypothetical protein
VKQNETKSPQPDLIDQIAVGLPPEVRADFYREMRHCRSLPECDEMLRILRAMMFLTLIMERVPGRVTVEREKLEQLFSRLTQVLEKTLKAGETYHEQLDRRLTELPGTIAKGISPQTIAACVNESLRQEFLRSTIPQTAEALGRVSAKMTNAAGEFDRTAGTLGKAYSGAVASANRAIGEMESAIAKAADASRRATRDLLTTFRQEYRFSILWLSCLALVLGIALGVVLDRLIDSRQQQTANEPPTLIQPSEKLSPIPIPEPAPRRRR